jgi:phosphatidylinositol alpha-1,6-mannosyltransferase
MGEVASALGPRRVCCLTSVPSDGVETKIEAQGIRVYRSPAAFSDVAAVQVMGLGMTLSRIMLRDRPQVIQLAMAYEGFLGLWTERFLRLPFVIYAHGNEILDAMNASYVKPRLALQRASRVFANSRFTADLVLQAGVDSAKIVIIRPGCDTDRFSPRTPDKAFREKILGARRDSRVLLTVGLERLKGHDMVIRALPRLLKTNSDVTYLIAGAGPIDDLDALACECGVRDHVVFLGLVPEEDLPGLYAVSDIFVMPSRQNLAVHSVEGFGLVYLEASASGKPVIGGRSGGVPDAVVDGTTGILVDPMDPDNIADTIRTLLSRPELSNELGENGRRRTVSEFRWESVGARIQTHLNEVVQADCMSARRTETCAGS